MSLVMLLYPSALCVLVCPCVGVSPCTLLSASQYLFWVLHLLIMMCCIRVCMMQGRFILRELFVSVTVILFDRLHFFVVAFGAGFVVRDMYPPSVAC